MKVTQEQLAELITQIITNIMARNDDMGEVSTEEIMNELTALLSESESAVDGEKFAASEIADGPEGMASDESHHESKSADNAVEVGIKSEDIADIVAKACASAFSEMKSNEKETERKKDADTASAETKAAAHSPASAPQRKYASLFLSQGASRDSESRINGFKSRLSTMNDRERRKTTFGMFGRAVKCIHASHGDPEHAAYTAERKFNDGEMAREFKALSATVPSDGGYLVPEIYANEVIELLYPSTVIYALGARRLGMQNGNMNIPKLKSGARAMFIGENRAISKSKPSFGSLKLSAKKLTAMIPMSNDLLRSTNFDNDVIVGQDVTKQMALGVDWGALYGTGGEFQPLGLMNDKRVKTVDVTSLGTDYASTGGAVTAMFPHYLVAAVLKDNVMADGLGFAFNTSVEQYLKSLRDNVGGFIYAEEMSHGTLVGYPYKVSNLIKTSDAGKTSIAFGNWNDLIIGEQGALEIETSREGSWTDDAGNLISAFENDQTLIRAINHVDTGLRHEESFIVAEKVAVPV